MLRFAHLLLACILIPTTVMGASSASAGVQERPGPEILPMSGPDSAPAVPLPGDSGGLDATIAARLAKGGRTVAGRPVGMDSLRRIYAQRGFHPVWIDAGVVKPTAQKLLAALERADEEGLSAADYHPDPIAERLAALATASPDERAELDLLLTDAAVRFAVHLRAGRALPKTINPDFAVIPPAVDPAKVLAELFKASDVEAYYTSFVPTRTEYGALKQALRHHRDLAKAGGWPLVPAPRTAKLEPGMRDPAVKVLRKRLAVTGEHDGTPGQGDLYDAPLRKAVERFQARHGLIVDGIVGASTIAALNVPVSQRVEQILSNLERLRWQPDSFGDRYVVVNIPDYSLKAYENGVLARDMRVVVGTPVRRTPILSSTITSVTLNPTWTMPPRLAREDFLPKLIRDPSYAASNGYTVFASWASNAPALDSRRIDWRSIGNGISKLRIRQDAGPNNSLGQLKFNIPNDFAIYLHDTPNREKFGMTKRAFSSGCVRLGDPMGLAEYVFAGTPEWPTERRQKQLDTGETKTVLLKKAVPVHLLYQTAWVDAHGVTQFREDIYARDAELLDAIARRGFTSQRAQRVAAAQP